MLRYLAFGILGVAYLLCAFTTVTIFICFWKEILMLIIFFTALVAPFWAYDYLKGNF
jgi:hypothetical protein